VEKGLKIRRVLELPVLVVVLKSAAWRKRWLMVAAEVVERPLQSWRVEERVRERTEDARVDALLMIVNRKKERSAKKRGGLCGVFYFYFYFYLRKCGFYGR
jgi:hypothetical protein